MDYTVPEGSRVFATADGTVKDVAQRNSTSGQTVVIDHGNGYETTYAHLSKVQVQRGQSVRRGEIIALTGQHRTLAGAPPPLRGAPPRSSAEPGELLFLRSHPRAVRPDYPDGRERRTRHGLTVWKHRR